MKNAIFALLLLLTPNLALAQVQLSVPDTKAAPGSKVLVPIVLSEGKDISSLQFTLSFDASVLSAPAGKTPQRGELLADHSVGATSQGNQTFVSVFSSSLSALKTGQGTVVGMILQVAAGVARGTAASVRLTDIFASDGVGNSVAVTARNGNILITDEADPPSAGANEIVFSHIVNGVIPGSGSFVTTMVFVNRTGAVASGEARLFKSDGTPFSVRLTDGRSGAVFPFTVGEGASVFLKTDGSGTIGAGYARVIASAPIGGTALFSQLDNGNQTVAEAGVGASVPGTRFSIPVLYQQGSVDTGIAFANISTQQADLILTLRNGSGAIVETALPPSLLSGRHLPRFATEFFATLRAQPSFVGSIDVVSTAPITAVALKTQGNLITTFPVIPPVYSAAAPAANPTPAISSLSPTSATAGGAAFTLTVNGSSFVSGAAVRWNGSNRTTSFVGATQLTAQIPASDIASAGTASVTVFNPSPGGGTSNAISFTVSAAGVARIDVTPASLDFGGVSVGQTKDLTLTVRSTGSAALTVNAMTSSNARFSATAPATPFIVAAGGQQTVTVRFAPTAGGAQSGTLVFGSNDPTAATVNLTGTGNVGTAPTIGTVTTTRQGNDSVKVDFQLTDPDGDVVKIDYTFFRGTDSVHVTVNSPADVNLAGFTSGTFSRTLTSVGFSSPFGTQPPTRVDIEVTDARGLKGSALNNAIN